MDLQKNSPLFQYLQTSEEWKHGYKIYHKFLGKPLGWFIHFDKKIFLRRLNRRDCCTKYSYFERKIGEGTCPRFVFDLAKKVRKRPYSGELKLFTCKKQRKGIIIPFKKGSQRGCVIFCSLKGSDREILDAAKLFAPFLNSEVDSFVKLDNLQNVYETVHPRALALSSLHSVNRVISSSLRLKDLIPKIGRLCSQILKTRYCSILLIDKTHKYLQPSFMLDPSGVDSKRKRFSMGKGIYGHVAETGEYYVSRNCISLPLIDDDVIGVITVKNKFDKRRFTRSDFEVLKALSEQAVVAIRNSQLLEEHERITLGSIKSINNLLDINLPRERVYTNIFSQLVYELATHMDLPEEEIFNIQRASSLLDTGHVGIPESIRQKKGKLTKKEYEVIKTHPYRGVEILQSIDALKPVIPIILYHHERYDGKGYPEGLRGEEIPIGARIMSLVVAFTAMITTRPYREAKTIEEAFEEIKHNSGKQFDPVIVEHFIALNENGHIIKLVQG